MKLICLQLDLARQKENLDFIKSYADFAVSCGYNALMLYLENAVRTQDTEFFDKERTYSIDEMREIVGYAESIGLDVIPAFENLAHLEKFFEYPQLEDFSEVKDGACEGRGFGAAHKRGSCGCVSNAKLRAFTDKYITDVSKLFSSEYVHMGLDEPFDFADCRVCRERIKKGESKADIFYEHVKHCYELVKGLGKTMMMWDDFFEYVDIVEKLPRDIILCNWNYNFIREEPAGHWTNRVKKDWLELYDKLGFRYVFCTYAHGASSTYNVESFTKYAEKHSPLGVCMTAWEKSNCFYHGSYPLIAYSGALWNGKIHSDADKLRVYCDVTGSKTAAEILCALQIPRIPTSGYFDVSQVAECDYLIKRLYGDELSYFVPRLKAEAKSASGVKKDILTDIYDCAFENLLNLRLQKLGSYIFDGYECGKVDVDKIFAELEYIERGFDEIENNAEKLWKKYRNRIKSDGDSLTKKFKNKKTVINNIRQKLASTDKCGILYFDTMLHDAFCTVRTEIKVCYNSGEEVVLYKGAVKPSVAGFEVGDCYGFRYAMRNELPKYVILSAFGEGALFPLNLRCRVGGKKYIADTAVRVCGNVSDEQNLLSNDTQFAIMGNNDGKAHFNDLGLARQMHSVKITFRELK